MKKKMIKGVVIITLAFLLFGLYCISGSVILKLYKGETKYADICISGSMEPKILTNSIIIIDKSVPFENIQVDDVVLFNVEKGFGIEHSINHQVSSIEVDENGETIYRTIGINNDKDGDGKPDEDIFYVTKEGYIGKVTGFLNFFALPNTLLFDEIPQHADDNDDFINAVKTRIILYCAVYVIVLGIYIVTTWIKQKKKKKEI